MSLISVKSTTPLDHPNQRNFKINNGKTHDFVLTAINGIIYLHSTSRESLMIASDYIKLAKDSNGNNILEIIDTTKKSRRYGELSGFLLRTDYKQLSSGTKSIATILAKHQMLLDILNNQSITTPSHPRPQGDE